MKLPKIPAELFSKLVSLFADFARVQVEVMGVFYWDCQENKYVLDVPYQVVTKVSIKPRYPEVPFHYIKVAEVHSHNTMHAYFSSVDDADELGTMLYGVVGALRTNGDVITYDVCTRAGMAGNFINIEPDVMIDGKLGIQKHTAYEEKWKWWIRNPKHQLILA